MRARNSALITKGLNTKYQGSFMNIVTMLKSIYFIRNVSGTSHIPTSLTCGIVASKSPTTTVYAAIILYLLFVTDFIQLLQQVPYQESSFKGLGTSKEKVN